MTFKKNEFLQNVMISPENAPTEIAVKGYKVLNWHLSGNIADTINCANVNKNEVEQIKLIPYGFTRLKISVFPKTEEIIKAETEKRVSKIKEAALKDSFGLEKFGISAMVAFGMIQVVFPFINQQTDFGVLFKGENGDERYYDNVKFNPYTFKESGESVITLDKCSFEADNNTSYTVVCASFENGEITGISNEIAVKCI